MNTSKMRRSGVALVSVLAFVVLLAAVVVAYMARSAADRPLAQSGFGTAAADQLARSALAIIVTDFKQEIANAGLPPTEMNITPQRSGNSADIPNLIRRSVRNDAVAAPGVVSRASGVNSTTDVSLNGRYVGNSRWNKHYLIPRLNAGNTTVDTIPIPSFVAPDWVLVTNSGPTVLASPNTSALGRYAYSVYDEGGLLDINVAGFPSADSTNAAYISNIGRKGTIAFVDLRATGMSVGSIDNFVGWRNYLSASPTNAYKTFSFPPNPTAFVSYFLDQSRTFLAVAVPETYPTSGAPVPIDQNFVTRSQLLEVRRTLLTTQDAMQYLGTFSRDINRSIWKDSLTVLANRFPLSRFDLFTNPTGNSAAIKQYFGLQYVAASGPTVEHWQYVGTSGTTLQSTIPTITGTNQNPDLLPLLQYALPGASISEILSIGASLIDHRDTNDDTTWIEFSSGTTQKAFGLDKNASIEPDAPPRPTTVVVLNRAFRNVGELGYAYRNGATTLDFRNASSSDAPLLDLFTYNIAATRAGTVNLNSQNPGVLAAIIRGAFIEDGSVTQVTQAQALAAATSVVTDATNGTAVKPVTGRQNVSRMAAAAGNTLGTTEEQQETVARVLAEVGQTRTWGLLIDVIAQSGRYPPAATNLSQFVVEGEKRYWLHVVIDRFSGEIIDQQLEAVYE